jgi:hypothetical protein
MLRCLSVLLGGLLRRLWTNFDCMDISGLLLGFVPIVSVAIGAGATYLWQVLGNQRTDKAVRVQTNVRLLELTSLTGDIYSSKVLPAEVVPILRRVVAALDDMQIALAFRDKRDVLWSLAQLRLRCEKMMLWDSERMREEIHSPAGREEEGEHLQMWAGDALKLSLQALKDPDMSETALRIASWHGYDGAKQLKAEKEFAEKPMRVQPH